MSVVIHPTAIVSPQAELGQDVEIGPWAIVGDSCVIGDGCQLAARAVLERYVTLGARVKVGIGSILGGDPQDLKFKGERTTVEVGEDTVIREYTTINRGTSQSFRTSVGRGCFIMSYVHLAHDCHVGDGVILGNSVQFAGHVTVHDRAIVSGQSAAHQFVKIGAHAFIGGCSRIAKDIPPYVKAVGNPIHLYGLNSVGLQRNNFDEAVIRELKKAYRMFFKSTLNVSQARERATTELQQYPEVVRFLEFMDESDRGVVL
ncbi:MAG TPA: acyl-ACP--UDP-N-acetylglucosamine O-acyltransferase [Gemmatimonadaceae bacterium]|jgi:UDP-N-acetylglucosamine acyltransferase|nr:acyl-ACP--UDP-N-acetylglucosamine O-acyltransferase [Gemmatimonadaceae bacterium]